MTSRQLVRHPRSLSASVFIALTLACLPGRAAAAPLALDLPGANSANNCNPQANPGCTVG